MASGQSPWHMWGNTDFLQLPGFVIPAGDTGSTASAPAQSQLVNVSYLRPDTFRFLLQAKLLSAPDISDLGADGVATMDVEFDVIAGVGRSNIILPSFAKLSFSWIGTAQPPFVVLFTDAGKGNASYAAGAFADPINMDQITAETIQVQARAALSVFRPSTDEEFIVTGSSVSVSGHFAPNVHVRPEWHSERFDGNEQGYR